MKIKNIPEYFGALLILAGVIVGVISLERELHMNKFLVCIPSEYGWGNYKEVEAYDAERAALKMAEIADEGEYSIIKGDEMTVLVKDMEGIEVPFIISAEQDIIYSAHVLEPPPQEEDFK